MISNRQIKLSSLTIFFSCLLFCFNGPTADAAELELYGTFHAMGVIVTLDAGEDPDQDAAAAVTYRSGDDNFQVGFPLSRIAQDRFVGSLFWLDPGTSYEVRVSLSDPDGGPLEGLEISASMATRSQIVIPEPTVTHYVHPEGTSNACTLASPCNLGEAIARAQAGEAVVLRGGTYSLDSLNLPRSGSPGAPIVIRGYNGETAVLDGADPLPYTWTHTANGVYRTTAGSSDVHLVIADGERLFPYESLDNLRDLAWDNTPGMFQDDTFLYVHLKDNKDPNAATMVVSRYESAFVVRQDHIYFLDLTFKHYGAGGYPKAIYFDDASDNLVQGCSFINNDLGIGIKRASHRNVIQDNIFSDTIFDWPWDGIKGVGGLEDGGISFYSPHTGRGTVIRRNTIHDDFDGMGVCPSAEAALTNETDVYDNVVYRMGDDGMETDGRCSNVRIWGNTFYDVLMGISLAPVYDGPVYAIRNLIYRTGVGNNSYTGSPFKFNSGYDQSGPMYLFHNTSDAALPGNNGLYIKAPGTWRMIYARNNIWAGTTYALNSYNTSQPVDLDYNNLYNTGAEALVRWDNTRYQTLAEFSSAMNQEPNGLNFAPGFLAAESGIYELDAQSDLVDAGLYIPGINHDYSGSNPDIGAFELGSGNHTPVANNDTATTDQDTAVTIDVIANDRDADGDSLAIDSFNSVSANGAAVTQHDGTQLTYTPPSGFSGKDSFTYNAGDGKEVSHTATVTVTVQALGTGDSDGSGDGGGSGCFVDMIRFSAD